MPEDNEKSETHPDARGFRLSPSRFGWLNDGIWYAGHVFDIAVAFYFGGSAAAAIGFPKNKLAEFLAVMIIAVIAAIPGIVACFVFWALTGQIRRR